MISPRQFDARNTLPRCSALLALLLSLLLGDGALAQELTRSARLGEAATQRVEIREGANLVSLYVVPDDPSLEAVLGAAVEKTLVVRDGAGRTYAPQHNIRELDAWPWGEALHLFATEPFTLEIEGRRIEPSSEIGLQDGWSQVPFFLAEQTPVWDAFSSIAHALTRVDDGEGRTYASATGVGDLTVLQPGTGYRVHLAEPATLTFDSARRPPTYEVGSIDTMLEIEGLKVGDTVTVTDPVRGGTFRVSMSGRPTDGGTVFVPHEFTEATEATRLNERQTLYDGEDSGGIVFDSFKLFYGPEDGDYLGAVDLHGHGAPSPGRLLNTETGHLYIPRDLRGDHSASYRYAISEIRLERMVPALVLEGNTTTDYVRPEWWGAVPYPTGWRPDTSAPPAPGVAPSGIVVGDPVYDATAGVATAINAAALNADASGREQYIVLSGMYGYSRVIEMQAMTVLKGETDGLRSDPGDAIRQGLRVMKGAPWHKWATKQTVDPAYAEDRTPYDRLMGGGGDPFVVVRHGRLSGVNRLVDLELDGNVIENEYVLSDEYRTASGEAGNPLWPDRVAEMLQNTPHWNGFTAYIGGTKENILGSTVRLENVHVHDYGGNLVLGAAPVSFGGSRDLKLGNTVKNHALYRTFTGEDSIDGIEVYGYAWASFVELQQGRFHNVHVHNLTPNPWFEDTQVIFGHRNDGLTSAELDGNEGGYYFGDDVSVDGVHVELENVRPRQAIFGYDTGRFDLTDVEVDNNLGEPVSLFNSDAGQGDQVDRSSYHGRGIRAVRGQLRTISPGKARESHIRGALTAPGTSSTGSVAGVRYRVVSGGQIGSIYGLGSNDAPFAARRPVVISDSGIPDESLSVYVRESVFSDVDQPLRLENADATDPAVQARLAVYWRDVSFSRWSHERSHQIQYFEGVTSRYHDGRVSEADGELAGVRLSEDGDGRFYFDLRPGLFFTPQADEFVQVRVSSGPAYTGWEPLSESDSDDPTLRLYFGGPGRVTANWTAAIRPIPHDVVFPE